MIKKPYLIQRADFKKNGKASEGIDSLLKFDYMGSAEFEFGALPKSLNRTIKDLDDYEIKMLKNITDKDGRRVCMICKPENNDEYGDYIFKMSIAKHAFMTKERVCLYEKLLGDTGYGVCEVWWDIENDIFFTLGKENAKKILKSIVAVSRKRKNNS